MIAVTSRALCGEPFLTRIARLAEARPEMIILREKDLTEGEYLALAAGCKRVCDPLGVPLVVNHFVWVAGMLGIRRIHLPMQDLREEDGMIVGYAYAHPFSSRAAYSRSVEVTIYLDKDRSGRGYGKALYGELEKRLKAMGITNLYAIVMYPENKESIAFHERMGYRIVGILNGCGEKFGRLWSVAYMEKII